MLDYCLCQQGHVGRSNEDEQCTFRLYVDVRDLKLDTGYSILECLYTWDDQSFHLLAQHSACCHNDMGN